MKKIKLVEIITGSLKAKIMTGVIVTTVVGGASIAVVNHMQNSRKAVQKDKQIEVTETKDTKNEDTKESKLQAKTSEEIFKEAEEKAIKEGKTIEEAKAIAANEVKKAKENGSSNSSSSNSNISNLSSSSSNSKSSGGSSNGSTSSGSGSTQPSTPSKPTYPAFTGFSYSLTGDGRQSGYMGGDNNYATRFPGVSSKSTMSSFNGQTNEAIQVLTQGAYQSKVKSKFMNKLYNGKYLITDVSFQTYAVPYAINKHVLTDAEIYQELRNQGVESTPGGLFSQVVGEYGLASDDNNTHFIKITIQFKEI